MSLRERLAGGRRNVEETQEPKTWSDVMGDLYRLDGLPDDLAELEGRGLIVLEAQGGTKFCPADQFISDEETGEYSLDPAVSSLWLASEEGPDVFGPWCRAFGLFYKGKSGEGSLVDRMRQAIADGDEATQKRLLLEVRARFTEEF